MTAINFCISELSYNLHDETWIIITITTSPPSPWWHHNHSAVVTNSNLWQSDSDWCPSSDGSRAKDPCSSAACAQQVILLKSRTDRTFWGYPVMVHPFWSFIRRPNNWLWAPTRVFVLAMMCHGCKMLILLHTANPPNQMLPQDYYLSQQLCTSIEEN